MKTHLSICIPTYNRASALDNCLNSIVSNHVPKNFNVEVCISNNGSSDHTEDIVRKYKTLLNIKYQSNTSNIGIAKNFLSVVKMAKGEFAWLIGDDDLLLPTALEKLQTLLSNNSEVDFFYVNSSHLDAGYLDKYPTPFDTVNLPVDMERFSKFPQSRRVPFFGLIDPKISFDFLGGMFLSVFRKENWNKNISALDDVLISDLNTFSNFDNTFPHLKIFAFAYAKSIAFFSPEPLSVTLTGLREWAPMYPMVRSVRLIQALEVYRQNGLSLLSFLRCKNFALRYIVPDMISMFLNKEKSGFKYIKLSEIILTSALFPFAYLSLPYFALRRFKRYVKSLLIHMGGHKNG